MSLVKEILIVMLLASPMSSVLGQQRVVYINGIQNTPAMAQESIAALKLLLNKSVNHGSAKKTFIVEGVYNPIGITGRPDVLDPNKPAEPDTFRTDSQETYVLKSAEEDISAEFSSIVAPHNQSRVLNITAARTIVAKAYDGMPIGNNTLVPDQMNSVLMVRTKEATSQLYNYIKSNPRTIVVAHSQGNLLANLAWARLVAELGQDAAAAVRIINVANVSMFSPNLMSNTHLLDSVVAASEDMGTISVFGGALTGVYRDTKLCSFSFPIFGLCKFNVYPKTIMPEANFLEVGIYHNFIDTYLSSFDAPAVAAGQDQGISWTIGKTTFADRMEDFIYTAANELSPQNQGGFVDAFDGVAINTTKWNVTGQATVSNGHLDLGVLSSINTKGKVAFTGPKLVIEFRASSSGQVPGLGIALLEVSNTVNRIYVQDTSYNGFGFLGFGEGAFASSQVNRGNHTANELEYRVTIEGSKMTIERGITLSKISLSGVINLGASIEGRSLYLDLGTNQQTSSSFDWIRVGTEPTPNPPLSVAFEDTFDAAALDSAKWGVTQIGNGAALTESGGFLNIFVAGGSCGVCGKGDGVYLAPKIPTLQGDFEFLISGEEIERINRSGRQAISSVGMLVTGGSATAGIYLVGDTMTNQGAPGHALIMYYTNGNSTTYIPAFPSRSLTVGQYYGFQFRIRRASGMAFVGYKMTQDPEWIESPIPSSFPANNLTTPQITLGSGDGGGTQVNSSFKARLDLVRILN